MQRRSVVALAFGASIAAGASPAGAQSLDWEPIADKDGRYSLEMPKGYRYVTTPQPDATTLRQFIFEWPGKGGLGFAIYDVSQVEGPDRPPTDLGVILRNAERNVQGRWLGAVVLQQADTQLGPAQGRSVTLGIDQGRRALMARIYYVNSRLYEMIALTTAAEQNGPTVARFMNSLRIVR